MTTEFELSTANSALALRMEARSLLATGGERIYHDALTALAHAVGAAAAFKNVHVEPSMYLTVAAQVLENLALDDMNGFLHLKPESVRRTQLALSRALDVVAAVQVASVVAHLEGVQHVDPAELLAFAERWVEAESTVVKIWPDIGEAAIQHLKVLHAQNGQRERHD